MTVDPEATEPAETPTVDCESEAAPGVTVIVGIVEVTEEALIVADIVVAVPATLPVKTTV